MRPMRLVLGGVTAVHILACAGADRSALSSFAVRDSAGIAIATSSGPSWGDGTGWRVETTPSLEIGIEGGDEPYELSRVFDAMRLPDGRILVGNSGTGEIRVFNESGQFIRSVGRSGNGPGEFGQFSTVRFWRLADGGLLAYDNGNLRVHLLDSTLAYQRSVRIESTSDGLRAFLQGIFTDGSWQMLALVPELRNEPGTYLTSAQKLVRFNPDGTPGVTLREVEGRTRFVNQFQSIVHYPFVPFTAEPLAATSGNSLWVNADGLPELEVRDQDGNLVRLVRLTLDLARTADIYPAYVEASLSTMDTVQRPRYERFYGLNHPMPEHVPAFQSLHVDADAHVWLERYRQPGDTVSRWEVIEPEGRWLGSVTVPPRFRILQVGPDFMLGRHLDSLGVERVRVHALHRATP